MSFFRNSSSNFQPKIHDINILGNILIYLWNTSSKYDIMEITDKVNN